MNDSGCWTYVKTTNLTEVKGLRTWPPLRTAIGPATILMPLAPALVLYEG
jgi:H+/gluconate symporter-like permease